MFKKIVIAIICISTILCFGCSCGKKKEEAPKKETPVKTVKNEGINNLTGLSIDKDKTELRPVAVMINNMNIAQPVQSGVCEADIVYETEVEGGITRLMAVYKDIASVDQIGPIRSARYAYVDLALGNGAVYYHCGQDPLYCAPHLKDIDDISIDSGSYGGKRINNGLSTEHTLYSFGDKLYEGLNSKNFSTTLESNELWQKFGKENEQVTFADAACNKVTIPFSASYHTVFEYDSSKGMYTRYFGTTLREDYTSKKTTDVKNVFVLLTNISNYPDGKHRQISLESGEGYYIVNGSYTKILWSKGAADASFKFTDENGKQLKVNAGKSWVCIADSSTSQPVFE